MGKPGQRKRAAHSGAIQRDRMWNSMRQLRTFTSADLVGTADAGRDNVKVYLRGLEAAGYVECIAKATGRPGVFATWRLLRNPGPIAPRLSRDGVFDAHIELQHQRQGKRLRKHGPRLLGIVLGIADAHRRNDLRAQQEWLDVATEFSDIWRLGQ